MRFLLMAPCVALILNELCSYIWIVPRYLADGVRNLLLELLEFLTDGRRDGLWWSALPETSCPVPNVYIYYVSNMINIWDTISTFIHLSRMFLPINFVQWTTDLIVYNRSHIYQIYMLNLVSSAGELQPLQLFLLAKFGPVDEPLASCMMVNYWVCDFKMTVGV